MIIETDDKEDEDSLKDASKNNETIIIMNPCELTLNQSQS